MPRIFLPVATPKNNAFLLRESSSDAAGPFALDSPIKPQDSPKHDPDNHGVLQEADYENSSTTTEGSIGWNSPDLINSASRRLSLENALDESRKDASSLKHDSGNTPGSYGTDKIWGAHAIPSPPAKRLKYYDAEDHPSQIERVTPRSRHTSDTSGQSPPASRGVRLTEEIEHVAPELEAGSSPTNAHLAESTSVVLTLPTERGETEERDAGAGQLASRFSQLQPEMRSPRSQGIGCPNVRGTAVHRPDGVSVTRNGASSLDAGDGHNALDLDTLGEPDPITHGNNPMVSQQDSLDDEQGWRQKLSKRQQQAIGGTEDERESFALEFNSQQLGLTLATAEPAEVGIAVDRVVGDDSGGSIIVVCDVDMAAVVASGAEGPLSKVRVGDRIVAVGGETAIGLDLSDVERRIVRGPRPLEIVFQRKARGLPTNANDNDRNTHYDHSNMTSNACNPPPRQTGEHSDGGASSSNTTRTSRRDGVAPAVGWRAPLGGLEKPSRDCLLHVISGIATREDFLQESQAIRDPGESVEPRTATQEEGLAGECDVTHTPTETSASHGINASGTRRILGAPVNLASDGGQGGLAASHSGVHASAEESPVASATATSNPTSLLSPTGVDARAERAPAAGPTLLTAATPASCRDGHDRFPDTSCRKSITVADGDVDGIRETLGTGTGKDGSTQRTRLSSPAAPHEICANPPPATAVATGSAQAAIPSLTQTPNESCDLAKVGGGESFGQNGEVARGKNAKRVRGATTVVSISRKTKAGASVSSSLATAKAVPEASIPTADEVTRILTKLGPKGMSEIGLYKNLTFDELSRVCRYAGVDLSKRLPKDTMAERLNSLYVEKGTLTNELKQKVTRIPSSTNGPRSAITAPQSRANLMAPVTARELSTPTSITQSPSTLPSTPARTRPPTLVPQRPPRSPPLPASSLVIPSGLHRPPAPLPPAPLPPAAPATANQSDSPRSVVDSSSPAHLSPTSAPGISREGPSVPTSGVVEVPERDYWEDWDYLENMPHRRGGSREEEEERSWWLEQESDDQWSTCSSPPMPQQVSPDNPRASQAGASAAGTGEGDRAGNPPPVRRNPLLPVVSSRRQTAVESNNPALFAPSSHDGAPSSRGSSFGRGFAVLPRFLLRSIRTIGTQAPLF